MADFQIAVAAGFQPASPSKLERRIVLLVAGEQKGIDRISLDSRPARKRLAEAWAGQHHIDKDELIAELERLCAEELGQAESQRQLRLVQDQSRKQLNDLVGLFVTSLKPTWHRDRKSIYCAAKHAELLVTNLWTHAPDELIAAVSETQEGIEAGGGEPADYRCCISLLKDAMQIGASRAMDRLPAFEDADHDPTVAKQELVARLAAWLLKSRNYRTDSSVPVTTTYYGWAAGIEGEGWQPCFTDPVFARRAAPSCPPEIAVIGASLTAELRQPSHRRFAKDVRMHGLLDTDVTLRTGGRVLRAWSFLPPVIESIEKTETGNAK